ncbi:MAG: hypothetical protein ACD_5C00045G0001 [uncultured bacterium]|nr:MAG: hypothetical protein ACD_5C00045G0001 [uncultured bacterium]
MKHAYTLIITLLLALCPVLSWAAVFRIPRITLYELLIFAVCTAGIVIVVIFFIKIFSGSGDNNSLISNGHHDGGVGTFPPYHPSIVEQIQLEKKVKEIAKFILSGDEDKAKQTLDTELSSMGKSGYLLSSFKICIATVSDFYDLEQSSDTMRNALIRSGRDKIIAGIISRGVSKAFAEIAGDSLIAKGI